MKKRSLTLRYSLTQFGYWAATTGTASFAAAYLLNRGLASGTVGLFLAIAGLLSCITQPIFASAADRAKNFVLKKMLVSLTVVCCACFSVQLLPELPVLVVGLLFLVGLWTSDAMFSLVNALCCAYDEAGYGINYGIGRGVGSVASAVTSLVLGFVIAKLGYDWMLIILVAVRLLSIVIIVGYPKIEKPACTEDEDTCCSISTFFSRYKWYCASLLAILFLGMFHAMTETYLISIMERLGGDSSNVGIALFICSVVAAPVILCFSAVRKHLKDGTLLKIAAITFLVKAVLFYFAKTITTVYLLELLQITSYGFLAPTMVYYANAKVSSHDMCKGQAFITAAYALGCSGGNFVGGQLLVYGVDVILIAGIIMALLGTIVMFLTVNKTDFKKEQIAEVTA